MQGGATEVMWSVQTTGGVFTPSKNPIEIPAPAIKTPRWLDE